MASLWQSAWHVCIDTRFHVRNGNTIVYKDPPGTSLTLLTCIRLASRWSRVESPAEWRSYCKPRYHVRMGSLTLSFFEHTNGLMGIAAYCARRLSEEEGGAAQRGARCVSVGLLLPHQYTPSNQLRALLPHCAALESIAADLVMGGTPPSLASYGKQSESPELGLSLPQLAYDPATYMSSVHRFLGPLLLPLIKMLQLPQRLLLYAPAPVERSAILAFNLAELVHAAFVHASHVPGQVRVRGMITLHDLMALQAEAPTTTAWIAWTSDRLLLDKTDLYDACLDVSSLMFPDGPAHLFPTKPLARFVKRSTLQPMPLTWNARELSLFLELADQEHRFEELLTHEGRPTFEAWREAEAISSACSLHVSTIPSWKYRQQDARMKLLGYLVVWVASLRFWLAEWWLVRSQLHVAVPASLVVPLGLRGDGGLSTGIVDLSEGDDDDGLDDEILSDVASKTSRRSIRSEGLSTSVESVDPLLAACGMVHLSAPHRRTTSVASIRSPSRTPPSAMERTITPAHPRYDPKYEPHLPLESMTGLYLFTLWSSYVRAMHIQVTTYLKDRVALLPPLDESSSLLNTRVVTVSRADFCQFGLDASSEIDVALMRSWLAPYSCTLHVSGWFFCCLF